MSVYNPNTLVGTTSYTWLFAEVTDAAGVPGQSNANPASLFNNHRVAKLTVNGTSQYYDPSYGATHATLSDIDLNAIDGYISFQLGLPLDANIKRGPEWRR